MSRTDNVGWLAEWWLPVSPRAGLAATLTFGLLTWLAVSAGLLGVFLAWVLLFGLSRHLVDVLIARAEGERWPLPEAASFNPFHELRRFAIAVFAVTTVVSAWVLGRQGGAPAVLAVALLVALPAMLALSAVDLDPRRWLDLPAQWRLARQLGAQYTVLLAQWLVLVLLLAVVGSYLSGPLSHVANTYALVFLYSTVGGLLYRQRARIGLEVHRAPEAREARVQRGVERSWHDRLGLAYGYFSRGNEIAGRTALRDMLDAFETTPGFIDWLFAELASWESSRPMLLLAPRLIDRQLASGDRAAAIVVAERCLAADAAFTRTFRNRAAIEEAARSLGRTDLVRELQQCE